MSEQDKRDKPVEKGVIYAPWERAFTRVLTPFEEFIHRQTTSGLLLMGTAIIALLLANGALADAYLHFIHTPMTHRHRCVGNRHEPAPLGERWPDDAVFLCGGHGVEARDAGGRAGRSAPGGVADHRRDRRHGDARADLSRHQSRRRCRARLGHTDGNRHRLCSRRAWCCWPAACPRR